jgi:hypothetical protein
MLIHPKGYMTQPEKNKKKIILKVKTGRKKNHIG